MLRLQTHPDQAPREVFEARKMVDDPQRERRAHGTGILQDPVEDAMGEDLDGLRPSHCLLAILLHPFQVVRCERVGPQWLRQNPCRRNSIL